MKFLTRAVLITLTFGSILRSVAQTPGQNNFLTSFDLVANQFVSDPARHQIYASIPRRDAIAVINTDTLAIAKMIPTGPAPAGMSMSPDGSRLYVALSGAKKIGVIDLGTLAALPSVTIAQPPWQVAAGLENRLYVTSAERNNGNLIQVDAVTGKFQAQVDYYAGVKAFVRISPDRNTLYRGNSESSPAELARFDVSTAMPKTLQTSASNSVGGGSGRDLELSHDGQMLCFPTGAGNGQGNYTTSIFNPMNFKRIGTFPQDDGFPGPIVFVPGDKTVYQYRSFTNRVALYDTATFKERATLGVPVDDVFDLITDQSGRYLFVADSAAIEVYDLLADVDVSLYATLGQSFKYQLPIYIAAQDFSVSALPPGLTFSSANQTISGTPRQDGTFAIAVQASDGINTVTVKLTITVYPNEHAQNLSTRGGVGTGDNALIAGFIVSGPAEEEIVVRALGPSLTANGHRVSGAISNPTLQLYDSAGSLIASNNDWFTDANGYVLGNVGLAPTFSEESGLWRRLSPGAYTVVVRGFHNTTGIALVEVYDLGGASRLANISTRAKVETADKVMIAGVILTGTQRAKMVIRAIGPSLSTTVATPLNDPQLDLYDNQGVKIASNDNWRTDQEAEIEATGLAPTDDQESAISRSLVPGLYTAVVSGVAGTTGIGLVEMYNLP